MVAEAGGTSSQGKKTDKSYCRIILKFFVCKVAESITLHIVIDKIVALKT